MFKRIAIIVMAIAVTIPQFAPLIAHAATVAGDNAQVGYVLNASDGAHLTDAEWCNAQSKHLAWPEALATCNVGGGTVSTFDKTTSSYVMFKDLQVNPPLTDGNGHTLTTNRYTLYIAQPNHKITFYKGLDSNGGQQYWFTSDALVNKAQLTAEPNTDPTFKYNWTGSYSANQYYSSSTFVLDPSVANGGRGFVIGNDLYDSQVGAVNTAYSSSWDLSHLTNHVPFGTSGQANCATLDIGCWVGKLTSGFTNVIKGIFGLLVDGFSWLFIPDGKNIGDAFSGLQSFLQQKLGFIAYPFTFFINIFQSFNGSNSNCNTTNCNFSAGNFMGGNYHVNLAQANTSLPGLWTLFTTISRGLLVLGLMYSIRREYHSTVAK